MAIDETKVQVLEIGGEHFVKVSSIEYVDIQIDEVTVGLKRGRRLIQKVENKDTTVEEIDGTTYKPWSVKDILLRFNFNGRR
tara:strand:+ start:1259 stop:1504 length:246 start_codon:yes stop_codon:yes gene_type:complete